MEVDDDTKLKEEKRHLLEIQLHRRLNEKYRYYRPIGKVEEFIGKASSGDSTILLLEAANR